VNLFSRGSMMTARKSFPASEEEFRHSRPTTLNENAVEKIGEVRDTWGKAPNRRSLRIDYRAIIKRMPSRTQLWWPV
jgi:hypothetical protein